MISTRKCWTRISRMNLSVSYRPSLTFLRVFWGVSKGWERGFSTWFLEIDVMVRQQFHASLYLLTDCIEVIIGLLMTFVWISMRKGTKIKYSGHYQHEILYILLYLWWFHTIHIIKIGFVYFEIIMNHNCLIIVSNWILNHFSLIQLCPTFFPMVPLKVQNKLKYISSQNHPTPKILPNPINSLHSFLQPHPHPFLFTQSLFPFLLIYVNTLSLYL